MVMPEVIVLESTFSRASQIILLNVSSLLANPTSVRPDIMSQCWDRREFLLFLMRCDLAKSRAFALVTRCDTFLVKLPTAMEPLIERVVNEFYTVVRMEEVRHEA
jgi:hypothetical protein